VEVSAVVTNAPPLGVYHAPQIEAIAIKDRLADLIAQRLNISADKVRRKNGW
jgi:CO/xanthine dehydrogenase Mo-binding subunit